MDSVRGVELIDEEVDDNAGDGNVEPEGESPAGDEAMFVETREPGPAESDDDERNDDNGENGVGREDGEIDGPNPALTLEMDDLVNAHVVDQVGDQEGAGDEEGGDHECFVDVALAGTDGSVASGEENSAGTVEGGVESGLGEHG